MSNHSNVGDNIVYIFVSLNELDTSSRFDLIIMYLIENCEYDVLFANIVLDDYGEGTLSR